MVQIHIKKRTKAILFLIIIAVFAAVGGFIEKYEKDSFIVETVAENDDAVYHSNDTHIINGKININSADAEELAVLNGIGENTAKKIIQYREENGPFMSIEDIMAVKGISENKFEIMRDMICVGEGDF